MWVTHSPVSCSRRTFPSLLKALVNSGFEGQIFSLCIIDTYPCRNKMYAPLCHEPHLGVLVLSCSTVSSRYVYLANLASHSYRLSSDLPFGAERVALPSPFPLSLFTKLARVRRGCGINYCTAFTKGRQVDVFLMWNTPEQKIRVLLMVAVVWVVGEETWITSDIY